MDAAVSPMPANLSLDAEMLTVFFERLRFLFAEMDRAYAAASGHYGFECAGCEDNCCRTRFFHHTYLEYLFIREGLENLERAQRQRVRKTAQAVCRQSTRADHDRKPLRLMCPLNSEGLCTLYAYRPMICRLHGIPHELHKPGGPVIRGQGCAVFDERFSGQTYYRFDRTPFYFKLAGLENAFKQAAGLTGRVKLTVAEMIVGAQ